MSVKLWSNKFQMGWLIIVSCVQVYRRIRANFLWTEKMWNFKVVFNHSCCHGNYDNVNFYLSIKIFHQYIFHLPSFSFWAATFLLPWFGKWHIITNCVQPPQYTRAWQAEIKTERVLLFCPYRWILSGRKAIFFRRIKVTYSLFD